MGNAKSAAKNEAATDVAGASTTPSRTYTKSLRKPIASEGDLRKRHSEAGRFVGCSRTHSLPQTSCVVCRRMSASVYNKNKSQTLSSNQISIIKWSVENAREDLGERILRRVAEKREDFRFYLEDLSKVSDTQAALAMTSRTRAPSGRPQRAHRGAAAVCA